MKIVTACFTQNSFTDVYGVQQWDYGQVLRIQGLQLPKVVEIHFSLQNKDGQAILRIGTTKDGVTDVVLPDSLLENEGIGKDYYIYAWVYITDKDSGSTEYKITIHVKARAKPEVPGGGENPDIFHEAVLAVKESAEKAEEAMKQAEGFVHGREDLPERAKDNAKFYVEEAKKTVQEIPGQVEDAKNEIDDYVRGKEKDLKGDTGNVYFAAFKVVNGRLKMYSDPEIDRVRFVRAGSRLLYRLNF